MSYYFEMRFFAAPTQEELFNTSIRLVETAARSDNAKEYIQTLLSRMKEIPHTHGGREDFIQAAFQARFVCWPQYNLLGLVTRSWPEKVFAGFPFSAPIQFQNSTDQDYPLETWEDNIPIFAQVKDYVEELSDDTVFSLLGWEPSDWTNESDGILYSRRSLVYKEIFKRLDLETWIDGKDGQFRRFTLSGVNTTEQLNYLATLLLVAENARKQQ